MADELLDKEIDEKYKFIKRRASLGRWRRYLAYGLKLLAGGAGLVIATGRLPSLDQEIGIVILVAILVDHVSSNHLRMIAETKAAHSYKALARLVRDDFNGNYNAVLAEGGPAAVQAKKQAIHSALSKGINDIEDALAKADIKALEALYLDFDGALRLSNS